MKKVKLLVMSDIHFEKFNGILQKNFTLDFFNKKISQIYQEGFDPVVILAGDIDNQDKSYNWMSKINCPIIYIAGNHEFWEGDYYETIELLKNNAPSNVTFLHNDVCEVGQYLIIGSTLWTDIGENLNPDLFVHASTRMNDMTSITAKKWYENQDNIEKIKSIFSEKDAQKIIQNKYWNGFTEREENKAAWNFISETSDVLELLNYAQDISTKTFLNNEATDNMQSLTDFNNPSLTYQVLLNKVFQIEPEFAISEETYSRLSKNITSSKERIFQKIRQFKNIPNKEIVILTHHLPFYEEVYIGQHRLKGEDSKEIINTIHHQNFFVREGVKYPEENLLDKAINGEVSRKNDIAHIVNYFNNGSKLMPNYLMNHVDIWIHGHEHLFNYSDFLKGFQIVSNTAGVIFQRLSLTEDLHPFLNKNYMQYHGIKISSSNKYIEDFKESLIRFPIETPSEEDKFAIVHMWLMKNFSWGNYEKNLERMINSCANIINSAVEFSALEFSNLPLEEKNIKISELSELTNQYIDIFNQNLIKHNNLLNHYALAVRVRLDRDFSIQQYFNAIYVNNSKYYTHLLGSVPELNTLSDFMGMFTGNMAFKNMEYLNIMKMQMHNLLSFINNINTLEPSDISQEIIQEFKIISNIINNEDEIKKTQIIVDRKWLQFLNSLTSSKSTPDSPELEESDFEDKNNNDKNNDVFEDT